MKNIAKVTIMLATFLFAIPLAPQARASSSAMLSVSPSSVVADIGSTFVANVMVSGGPSNVVGYDFFLTYDQNILQVTQTSLGHTAFDLNNNGNIGDDPVLVLRDEVFNSAGFLREAAVLEGGASVSPSSASLLAVTFQVNNPLMGTAADLSRGIHIGRSSMVGFDSSGGIVNIALTTSDATFSLPVDSAVRDVGCRAVNGGLNILAKGFTNGIFCRVVNNGNVAIDVHADFTWIGLLTSTSGTASSPTMTLQPGQRGELDASITVSGANDVVVVTGTPTRDVTFPDSTVAHIAGPADSFVFNVNP